MKNSRTHFAAAVRSFAEKALEKSEHPTREQLLAFAKRRLSSDEMENVEEHLALCGSCADLVLEARKNASLTGRLRSLFASPAVAYGVAGICLAVALISVWKPSDLKPRANIHMVSFESSDLRGADASSGRFQPVGASPRADSVLLILTSTESGDVESVRAELQDVAEETPRVVWTWEDVRQMPAGNFSVDFPSGYFAAGRYALRLYASRNGQEEVLEEYFLEFE